VLGSSTRRAAALSDRITFMAFDLLSHGGIDARRLPYAKRRSLLERAVSTGLSRIQIVPQVTVSDDSLAALLTQGFEGMMVKDVTAPYASGKRGKGWMKVKPQMELDAVVMGFTPGANGFTGLIGSVVFGQHDGSGRLVEVGRCSGMDMKTREDMTRNEDDWLGAVIEVKHMGTMKSGGLRHPQFARRRDDKPARECLLD
jgi:ATP-dependent DNA ligase